MLLGAVGCFGEPPQVQDETGDPAGSGTTGATGPTSSPTTTGEPSTGAITTGSSDDASSETAISTGGFRQAIVLDTTSAVGEPLTDVPVLLRIGPMDVDYDAIAPDGSDVRFYDEAGTTMLPFEIEEWHGGQVTDVWLLLPQVDGPSVTVQLVYGSATEPAAFPTSEVWRNGYEAVWHLPSLVDSTGHGHDLDAIGSRPAEVMGVVGPALRFGESTEALEAADDPALQLDGAGTVEAWVNAIDLSPLVTQEHRVVVGKGRAYMLVSVNGSNALPMFSIGIAGGASAAGFGKPLAPTWTRLVGTFLQTKDLNTACVSVGTGMQMCGDAPAGPLEANNQPVRIGSPTTAADVDEVRLSLVNRSPGWLGLQQRSLLPGFATFLAPEPL